MTEPMEPDELTPSDKTRLDVQTLDAIKKSNKLKVRLLVTVAILVLFLIFYVGFLVTGVRDDFAARDANRAQINQRLDEQLATIRCFAEYQGRWDEAVSSILQENLYADPGDPGDAETINALDRLKAATEDLSSIRDQCIQPEVATPSE